jgi:phenylalanyl-tRNA synthetase beta chain
MKISLNWLNEYLTQKISAEQAEEILTSVGLEVEGVDVFESIKGGLAGVVIGEVKEKSQHPDADRLSITKVDVGSGELLQIVCGAPNVDAGQKVLVATIGTILYPGGEKLEIKKSKIRGVESQGMICAEDELGLGTSHDGIMVLPADTKVGTKASSYFQLENDYSLELNITPNRCDATSHIGVARDVVAYQSLKDTSASLKFPNPSVTKKDPSTNTQKVELSIENKEACKRYSGIVVSDLKVGPSPQWLQNKLLAVGLRPINNVVDITNYVQFEYGHPLHAFDLDKVDGGKIVIKNLPAGTPFITLDGVERKLNADDLMICSATKPMCIAGVFGGIESGVTEKTVSVFVESAYFSPAAIRKTSKAHGLKTDASFRFERGTDPNITTTAALRAASLLVEICGGRIASELLDDYPVKIDNKKVDLRFEKVRSLLGIEIPADKIKSILKGVGIEIEKETTDSLQLSIPAYKVDVTRDVDVIEEIIRIYGFNEIKINTQLKAVFNGDVNKSNSTAKSKVTELLIANGFYEILTNSLLHSKYGEKLKGEIDENAVRILNPISSELDILRNDFIYSGLEVVSHNLNHKAESIKIFEFGKTYRFTNVEGKTYRDHYTEQNILGVWLCGNANEETWYNKTQPVSIYDLKGTVETIIELLEVPGKPVEQTENSFYKSGYTIVGFKNKAMLATFGEVSTSLLKTMDIKHPVYYAEFNWDAVLSALSVNHKSFTPLPKYPSVRRDLALVLDKVVEYRSLKEASFKTEKNLLHEVNIFDVYEGKGIPEGKKSYALSFVFRDKNKTLTDADIDKSMQKLIDQFKNEFNAEVRS